MEIVKSTGTVNLTKCQRKPLYIVIHYTAGTTSKDGSAANLIHYYKSGNANASSDFVVDDKNVIQYTPSITEYYTWGVGGKLYPSMSTSLGGEVYGKCTNKNCINIEVCSNKANKKSLQATDTDWYFTDEELELTAELVNKLMADYAIPLSNVVMHHQVTGKHCPAMWTNSESDLNGWYLFRKKLSAPVNTKLYRVQVGAFAIRANAEKMLAEVKKHYPNAFISES